MKKALFGLFAVACAVLLAALGYGTWLLRSLRTPEFQGALLARAEKELGTDVRVRRIDVSLFSGVTLEGITVANPPPFTGDLLSADGFVLRYRLWPLLSRRFEVERVALHRPNLAVAMDARGVFNYERLGAGARRSAGGLGSPAAAALPLRIVLSRLSIDRASVTVTDAARARLATVESADLESAFEVEGGVATGRGRASIRTVELGRRLIVRDVKASLVLTKQALSLAPLRAQLAGGVLRGDVAVRFEKGFRYVADLELSGSRVETLLEEAGAAGSVTGTLEGRAHFEGTGGLPTVRGRGQGRIGGCRVAGSPSLTLVAELLGLAELAKPDLDECRAEFVQTGAHVVTPVVSLKGPRLEVAGRGSVNLESGALDYDLRLALAPALFAKVTRRELRAAFETRPDGFSTIDFHLSGTTADPRTDLVSRIGRGAAEQAIRRGLGRLFGKPGEP